MRSGLARRFAVTIGALLIFLQWWTDTDCGLHYP
jgi:hypothetical protein